MISVIDYGAGNIGSVLNMIRHVGGSAEVVQDVAGIVSAKKLLLPGVGSFDNAVTRLNSLKMVEPIKETAKNGRPILGICLGMQLLANQSEEGKMSGLGLIPGNVKKFNFDYKNKNLKIPHMGWNRVYQKKEHSLIRGLSKDSRFYFVHSYYFECENESDILLEANYGHVFTAGVQHANVMGVQFHPEKSHNYGMQLIKNFLEL